MTGLKYFKDDKGLAGKNIKNSLKHKKYPHRLHGVGKTVG
jgi:hypothetical protein